MKRRAVTGCIVSVLVILVAGLTPVVGASAADGSGATAVTPEKKKCKKAKKGAGAAKKAKCKKKKKNDDQTDPIGDGPPPPGILGANCPTGTVSGASVVTVGGTATNSPGAPVIVQYTTWDGAAFVNNQGSTTANSSSGAWSFSFTPNTGYWNPLWGTWVENFDALYAGDSHRCTFNVGA